VTSFSSNGIAYDREGPRGERTIVLIHAGVADRGMWDAIWPELTGEWDVIRLDLRGFGDSASRPNGAVSHPRDVLDTLSELGVQVAPSVRDHVRRMQRRAFEVIADREDVEEQELNPPALDRLGEIEVPVLVLLGGLDLDTVRDAADRVVAGIAGARRVDWPDAGHLPSLENPAAFASLLREWVNDTPAISALPGFGPRH